MQVLTPALTGLRPQSLAVVDSAQAVQQLLTPSVRLSSATTALLTMILSLLTVYLAPLLLRSTINRNVTKTRVLSLCMLLCCAALRLWTGSEAQGCDSW
jgi:hypothetical protein